MPCEISGFFLFGRPLTVPGTLVPLCGLAYFFLLLARRVGLLRRAQPDAPLGSIGPRLANLLRLGLLQARLPRSPLAGAAHILIFLPFLFTLPHVAATALGGLPLPFPDGGPLWEAYLGCCDAASTLVAVGCAGALGHRLLVRPARYAPQRMPGALAILAVVLCLVLTDSGHRAFLAASGAALVPAWTLGGLLEALFPLLSQEAGRNLGASLWLAHTCLVFGFLCALPQCKQFHEITGLLNVFLMRPDKGALKPLRHGIGEEEQEALEQTGIRRLTDCTWKHILDFYSCADCGRCSDVCPAALSGRALSPRELTHRAQRLAFAGGEGEFPCSADEFWSCTLCGACEEECPLGIAYMDKIVDLRRAALEDGVAPVSVTQALEKMELRGNPWGVPPAAAWPAGSPVEDRVRGGSGDVLLFPDSFSACDERARRSLDAACEVLLRAGVRFGIPRAPWADSGHEARRLGEEFLFMQLRDEVREDILRMGPQRILTVDPHALDALRHDYRGLPPVEHISELLARKVGAGEISFVPADDHRIHVFHDPCYLGRRNGVWDAPRRVLQAMPGLRMRELARSGSRSQCCGGPLSFFHDPEQRERPEQIRLRQALDAGAEVIVTACPWCLVNLEEAVRSAGVDVEVVDLAELAAGRLAPSA